MRAAMVEQEKALADVRARIAAETARQEKMQETLAEEESSMIQGRAALKSDTAALSKDRARFESDVEGFEAERTAAAESLKQARSEERRVGKEGRSRWAPDN